MEQEGGSVQVWDATLSWPDARVTSARIGESIEVLLHAPPRAAEVLGLLGSPAGAQPADADAEATLAGAVLPPSSSGAPPRPRPPQMLALAGGVLDSSGALVRDHSSAHTRACAEKGPRSCGGCTHHEGRPSQMAAWWPEWTGKRRRQCHAHRRRGQRGRGVVNRRASMSVSASLTPLSILMIPLEEAPRDSHRQPVASRYPECTDSGRHPCQEWFLRSDKSIFGTDAVQKQCSLHSATRRRSLCGSPGASSLGIRIY